MLKICRVLRHLPSLTGSCNHHLFHVACRASASTAARGNANGVNSAPAFNPQSKFPRNDIERLAQCGCSNDLLLETTTEQFCDRMKVFGVKYLEALRVLKRVRYFKTGRLLLKHLCSTSPSLPPYVVLEMTEMLVSMYMEGANEVEDEQIWQSLVSKATKVPGFLKPTISLLLKSCCPVNIVPKLPPNMMSRSSVITALLGNYIRYGKTSLFESLLTHEPDYDLTSSEQLLRLLALHTNSHATFSSTYLQYLSEHNVGLSDVSLPHFDAVVRQSRFWDVSDATLTADGQCNHCGEVFQRNEDLSEKEFVTLKNELLKYLSEDMKVFTSATEREISDLRRYVKQKMESSKGGASLVVDALNVLYTGINYGRAGYKVDDILRKALQKFANVMLIIRKGGDTNRIWNERDYFSDPRLSAFFCHRRSSDDLFILLAVMELGRDAYFMTNDFFVNHRGMLSSNGKTLFDRWVDTRAVRLDVIHRNLAMPSQYCPYVHRTCSGFHVPVKTVCKSVASYSYLCVRRNLSDNARRH